jgi:hypothetical protein
LIPGITALRLHLTSTTTNIEIKMAEKRSFPTKACPRCNEPIHAAKQSQSCGWTMNSHATAVKQGRPKGQGVTMQEIESVKAVVQRIGAAKVQELAGVLG